MATEREIEEAKSDPKARAQAAVSLLVAGASFADVARVLEFTSPQEAKDTVEKALSGAHTLAEKEQVRAVMERRYERLFQSVYTRAVNQKDPKQLEYNARAQALVDRIVRLRGVDAPQKVEITPTEEQLAQYVQMFKARMGFDEEVVEEAEIMEEAHREIDR